MSALYYYRHIIGDYDRDTKDLSLLEHGVYRRLLDAYYANRGPISAAPDRLFRCTSAMMPDEQACVLKIAATYFEQRDGLLHHDKADDEIARVLKESSKQAEKANARWAREREEAEKASQDAAARATVDAVEHAGEPSAAGAGGMPSHSHSHKKATPPKPPRPTPAWSLPDWMPRAEWDDFLKMRQRIRKPATDRAKELVVGKLAALREGGHDPKLVLLQSIEQSWQTVYPLKTATAGRRSVTEERNEATAQTWAEAEA